MEFRKRKEKLRTAIEINKKTGKVKVSDFVNMLY